MRAPGCIPSRLVRSSLAGKISVRRRGERRCDSEQFGVPSLLNPQDLMKTSFHRSIIASVIAAMCVAPAAFAKPKGEKFQQGAPGASGKHQGKAKGAAQTGAVQQSVPGSVGGIQQRGPGPGVTVVIPPPPIPPPPPYPYRSYRRSTYVADSNVAAVQSALKQRGYYRGAVDGDAGPVTRAAIVNFRADHGLGSSSRIDEPLLRALGL